MLSPAESMKLAFSGLETFMEAAVTINARMAILFSAAFTGSPGAVRESQRMVTEKADAAMEMTMAAGTATFKLWLHAASTMSLPDMAAWAKVAEATFAPACRAIKANARRLS